MLVFNVSYTLTQRFKNLFYQNHLHPHCSSNSVINNQQLQALTLDRFITASSNHSPSRLMHQLGWLCYLRSNRIQYSTATVAQTRPDGFFSHRTRETSPIHSHKCWQIWKCLHRLTDPRSETRKYIMRSGLSCWQQRLKVTLGVYFRSSSIREALGIDGKAEKLKMSHNPLLCCY